MPVAAREARPADLERLVPLFDGYRSFYGQRPDPARARDFLAQRFEQGDSRILLAEDEGRALGFAQVYASLSSVATAPLWILNDLFVEPGARRSGVARLLLDAAAGLARREGVPRLVLETARDNGPAQALYLASGWQPEDGSRWFSLATGAVA